MKGLWAGALALGLALSTGACGSQATSSSGGETVGGSSSHSALSSHQNGRPISGAIFTTDSEGEAVNQNIYDAKEDVYLNGGPRKPGAAGLPDGTYYYQITDPGCMDLLAGPSGGNGIPDTTGKVITVEDGEFTELIQLFPYNDTPNPGGVYKVWVTPTDLYDADATTGGACFGFLPRFSKTDAFKVRAQQPPPEGPSISGFKFYDPSLGEAPRDDLDGLGGIRIDLRNDEGELVAFTFTTGSGFFEFDGLDAGDYSVIEVLPNVGVWLPVDGTVREVRVEEDDVDGLVFRNVCFLEEGDNFLGQPKGPFLDMLFAQLEGTGILTHPLIALVAGGDITSPEQLRDFLMLDATTNTQLLAQYVMNFQINLTLGIIAADDLVLTGDSIEDVVAAGPLLASIAEAALVPEDLDEATILAVLNIVRPLLVLQEEACAVAYD